MAATVERAQEGQRERRALVAKDKTFAVGEAVLVRDYRRGEEKWIPGLVAQEGPVSYTVDMESGVQWKRHAEQMRVGDHALLGPTNPVQPAVLDNSGMVSQQDSSPSPPAASSPVGEEAPHTSTMDPVQEAAPTAEGLEELGWRYPGPPPSLTGRFSS